MVVGLKSSFKNIEQFFYSTIKSPNNNSSGIYGQPPWLERTDLKLWAAHLEITPINRERLVQFIESAKKEINEYMYSWIQENSIDISFLDAFK